MSVGNNHHHTSGIFYITFTCCRWLPLFDKTNGYDLVYKWFDYLRGQQHYILGYVIMPNHLHAMLGFRQGTSSVNKIISNGKRFMAYEIVQRLQSAGEHAMLNMLADAVSASDAERGKLHQVFEPSFDCKECYSDGFIWQKLNYMHQNPLVGKWNLATEACLYPHSSALFYSTGRQGIYPVTSVESMKDINLTLPDA